MPAGYFVDFKNKTDRAWIFGLFVTFPKSTGLDTLAWRFDTVGSGRTDFFRLDYGLGLFLAAYSQNGSRGVYRVTNSEAVNTTGVWSVVGGRLRLTGTVSTSDIFIHNHDDDAVSAGLSMGNRPVACRRSLESGATVQFGLIPISLHAALFNELQAGEVIAGNVAVGPLLLDFPKRENQATVTATLRGSETVLSVTFGPPSPE